MRPEDRTADRYADTTALAFAVELKSSAPARVRLHCLIHRLQLPPAGGKHVDVSPHSLYRDGYVSIEYPLSRAADMGALKGQDNLCYLPSRNRDAKENGHSGKLRRGAHFRRLATSNHLRWAYQGGCLCPYLAPQRVHMGTLELPIRGSYPDEYPPVRTSVGLSGELHCNESLGRRRLSAVGRQLVRAVVQMDECHNRSNGSRKRLPDRFHSHMRLAGGVAVASVEHGVRPGPHTASTRCK